MEMIRERPTATEAKHITDWPKVSQWSIAAAPIQVASKAPEIQPQPSPQEQAWISDGKQTVTCSDSSTEDLDLRNQCPRIADKLPTTEAAQAPKVQPLECRWLGLGRFSLQKSQWPNPHLSIGTKCNRMGSNKCWEASGPAQELFAQISQNVGDLLDARVEDIEEGEPVAGHVLIFGMYMIGKDIDTARPTLVFTCQRPKPRRRAIKFIKESEILKDHSKIALAEKWCCSYGPG